jgi:iron complex outermembrane receptor protein
MPTNKLARGLLLAGVSGLVIAAIPVRAWAQSVDYGTLEQLFSEPVTTSATGTPQRVSEAPANMTIITADEIRQSGSRSIPEILSRVPGLDILQAGINSYDVGVRGFQTPFQPRLLVLVDGRQVFIDDYSRTLWDNVPVNIDDIRQIEIVEGAASALFGSNAVGGVINIVTYSPLYDNNNVASVAVGTQQTRMGDATATYRGDWGGTKLSAGGYLSNEFNSPRLPDPAPPGQLGVDYYGDQPPGTPWHSYFTNSSVFRIGTGLTANTEFTYSRSAANTADPADFYTLGYQKAETYSLRAGANWDDSNWTISFNTYYNHSDTKLYETTDGGPPYEFVGGLLVSQLQYLFKAGSDNTFRIGAEYRNKTSVAYGQQLQPQLPEIATNNYALSGMWLWQITPTLSLTNSLRGDMQDFRQTGTLTTPTMYPAWFYNHTNRTWSANSDLVWRPTRVDSFRVGFGQGVEMPSFLQDSWSIIQNFGTGMCDCSANPRIKPTIVQDFTFDYTRHIPAIMSDVKLTPYYEINRDLMTMMAFAGNPPAITINGTTYPTSTNANVGNDTAWGLELQLKGSSPSGFRWDASYSFSRVADKGLAQQNLDWDGSEPHHHLRLLLGYTHGPWEFDAKGMYLTSSNMLRSPDGGDDFWAIPVSGYISIGGRIGYKINDHVTLSLSGTSLNSHYITASPYPAIQRQLLLTLTAHL